MGIAKAVNCKTYDISARLFTGVGILSKLNGQKVKAMGKRVDTSLCILEDLDLIVCNF